MSSLVAAAFIGIGIVSLFQPKWLIQIEREVKATGTDNDPNEIEFADWWFIIGRMTGIFAILFGLLIWFNVI
ncbi:hypothetical protein C491_20022 [Natronococcus amylolyticus DSM 10524]|uniref:DUF6199 domain-containing protein n=1 Tax=Natronococcus amylolyticus DSM 10524 TaxID=1227497 RepID=L9WY67_9EURY|nr:hypothetical protein C491_20022 [Natronococcus amylolyticus DSM 10524]